MFGPGKPNIASRTHRRQQAREHGRFELFSFERVTFCAMGVAMAAAGVALGMGR